MSNKYCNSLNKYSRFRTRVVNIGNVPLGGNNPIRVQSMTTTNTLDVESTVKQSIKIINEGADYIRITAPSIKEAYILKDIKKSLYKQGYKTPLIADIHFTPNAAIQASKIVEKVRINPGNYADRKKFKSFEYTDAEYNHELDRIYERFSPLIKVCKEHGTAMRIGTNHGSLSDRIMNRYGDTPLGMVESAMEFLRICENHSYFDIVLSMKSSNPIIMVQAYRLLVNTMMKENMNYPLHLGVTEAGEGMEGRIKSAVGIGVLLEDGLGDTIRVSLTENPELEIPVAKMIVNKYKDRSNHECLTYNCNSVVDPFSYTRRLTKSFNNIGGNNVPIVIVDALTLDLNKEFLSNIGYDYCVDDDKWSSKDFTADYIYIGDRFVDVNLPPQLGVICLFKKWKENNLNIFPVMNVNEYRTSNIDSLKFLSISSCNTLDQEVINLIKNDDSVVLIIKTENLDGMREQRNLLHYLISEKCKAPVVIHRSYNKNSLRQVQINASIDIGGLFVDGLGDGLLVCHNNCLNIADVNALSFELLQVTRTRITKTDYISCPSCGRTQFDLIETTALVRKKTAHLKGLKIAIMGCIVNGPGEMADADYGYVGTGNGLITLYKKHDVVKKNIPMVESVSELITLIKDSNDWVEPSNN